MASQSQIERAERQRSNIRQAQALLVEVANDMGDCDDSADIAEIVETLDGIADSIDPEDVE